MRGEANSADRFHKASVPEIIHPCPGIRVKLADLTGSSLYLPCSNGGFEGSQGQGLKRTAGMDICSRFEL